MQAKEFTGDREDAQDPFKRGLAEGAVERHSVVIRSHRRIGTLLLASLVDNATEPSVFLVLIHTVGSLAESSGQHTAD